MQREIKFRGKRITDGEWLYGYYFVNRGKHFIVTDGLAPAGNTFKDYEIDPMTIGQYTGLKDKNGREIYEGDVVCLGDTKRRTGVIVRSDTKPGFVLEVNGTAFDLYYRNQHRYEVIGNLHDNSELIKPE